MGFRGTGAGEEIWVPARAMVGLSSPPGTGLINNIWPVLLFDSVAAESAGIPVHIPTQWSTVIAHVHWCNAGIGAGGVLWVVNLDEIAEGAILEVGEFPSFGSSDNVETAGAQGELVIGRQHPYVGAKTLEDPRGSYNLRVSRVPADGGDTLPNDAGLVGVLITRQS